MDGADRFMFWVLVLITLIIHGAGAIPRPQAEEDVNLVGVVLALVSI